MIVYNYNPTTGEFLNESEAYINPVATRREGHPVYLLPAYATFQQPPEVGEHKIAIFDEMLDKWLVKDDYRNCYACDTSLNVIIITEIGSLPEGFILITEGQAKQIEQDDLWYIVQDGELIKNPHYEEDVQAREAERISHLKCTKRVFVLMLEQMGLDYFEQIRPLILANRQASLEWELCVELERSNPLLNIMGAQLGVNPEQIDNLFKYANGEISQEEFING